MPYAQCTPLEDSIALENRTLSGWGEKEVPRSHAQGWLWDGLAAEATDIAGAAGAEPQSAQPAQPAHTPSPYEVACAKVEPPLSYTPEQKHALLTHIEQRWGKSQVVIPAHPITYYSSFLQGLSSPQISFEVRCIPAHLNQRYYDLYFTVGLGAYTMAVPTDSVEGRDVELERIELMLRLPPFYGDDNFRDFSLHTPQGGWPLLLLRSLALKVLHSHQFAHQKYLCHTLPVPYVTYYQSYHAAPSMAPWPQLAGCMLLEPQEFSPLAHLCKLPQSTHELIRLMGVLPLYQEELKFKEQIDILGKSGGRALLRKMQSLGFEPWLGSLERPVYVD